MKSTLRATLVNNILAGSRTGVSFDDDVTTFAATHVSVLMIDIDYFKKLNDTLGHAAGDHAAGPRAQCVTRRVCAPVISRTDTAARSSAYCSRTPSLAAATGVAERIRSAVEDLEIDGAEHLPNRRLTVSIGVAIDAPRSGIKRADGALYAAKNGGRNRIVATTGRGRRLATRHLAPRASLSPRVASVARSEYRSRPLRRFRTRLGRSRLEVDRVADPNSDASKNSPDKASSEVVSDAGERGVPVLADPGPGTEQRPGGARVRWYVNWPRC